MLDEIPSTTTIVFDVGEGAIDRSDALATLDRLLGPETIVFADAYATDLKACAARLKHPERLVGYGSLGSPAGQRAVEIVDSQEASDDALALAQELFENIGKATVLVADLPGLYLGRLVGSIVNEAVTVVHEEIASPDDVDTAMRLGTNYPNGPIAWGREIGGRRIARILSRLANAEGGEFAPNRALWVLDIDDEDSAQPIDPVAAMPSAIPTEL
jgi:3-hydroxybutyryl-CoA dehydrogenase